jgi:peptidyl-tRNA hydrolase
MALKQIFIINKDLGMRTGKIAVQVAHGETLYMSEIGACKCVSMVHDLEDKEHQMKDNFKEWTKDGMMKKIVLKATKEEMLLLIGISKIVDDVWFDIVFDKGLTQVPTDSMTCLVFEPLNEELADHFFGSYKLL